MRKKERFFFVLLRASVNASIPSPFLY